VKHVDNSYDLPATTASSRDPYTNETTTETIPGYHVEDVTIEITIKNQPFAAPVNDENYNTLYYNVRVKGHFEENWRELYDSYSDNLPAQSNSMFTVISISADYPDGGQVDFQVEAILGNHYLYYTPQHPLFPGPYEDYGVAGTSGWSNTQTITIPESIPSPENSSSPTSKPDNSTQPASNDTPQTLQSTGVTVSIIAVVLAAAGLRVYVKKRRR